MTEQPDALRRLRSAHEAAVLRELRRSGALSRGDLTKRVGLSRTTLFAIISDLLERRAVVEQTGDRPRGRGRPALEIALNAQGAELIGIDLRRTRVHLVVANSRHEIVGQHSAALAGDLTPAERASAAIAALEELAAARKLDLSPVQAVGLGLPGFVQDPTGSDLTALTPAATEVAERIGRHVGVPLVVDNNSRLSALAEVTWGAARGHRHVVCLRWSEGVGGGLVIDGQLVGGAHGTAGEIGHTSCDPSGPACHCGGRGCLEGMVSLPALLAECAARGGAARDAAELVAQAAGGREPAVSVVREAAVTTGRTLAALVTQLDPECVLIEGELGELEELVLATIRQQLATYSLPSAHRSVTVASAALGEDGAARGAVALLLQKAGESVEDLLAPGVSGPRGTARAGAPREPEPRPGSGPPEGTPRVTDPR